MLNWQSLSFCLPVDQFAPAEAASLKVLTAFSYLSVWTVLFSPKCLFYPILVFPLKYYSCVPLPQNKLYNEFPQRQLKEITSSCLNECDAGNMASTTISCGRSFRLVCSDCSNGEEESLAPAETGESCNLSTCFLSSVKVYDLTLLGVSEVSSLIAILKIKPTKHN